MRITRRLARLADAGPGSTTPAPGGTPPGTDQRAATSSPSDGLGADGALVGTASPDRSERLAWLRQSIDRLIADQARHLRAYPPARPSPRGAPGERRATAAGEIRVVEEHLGADHRHGDCPVAAALQATPVQLAGLALDEGLLDVEVSRLLYIDTETTGLSGGAGTLPFLIGMAWFDRGALRVQQLVLRQPGEEVPMLVALAERLAWASGLVSYNGKSFDWPLLRNRFVLNRLAPPPEPAHLDLLHCARRVFKRRVAPMRLGAVEVAVMGYERVGDIDSALIPQRYFEYLRGADGECLCPIIEHNRLDLIALAALLGDLAARFEGVATATDDARDRLSLAELALRGRDLGRALDFARAAAAQSRDDRLAAEALALAAGLHKRRREPRATAACLREALALVGDDEALAAPLHLALAKLLEHQLRDPATALVHAAQAGAAEEPVAHERRLERLARRLCPPSGKPGSVLKRDI